MLLYSMADAPLARVAHEGFHPPIATKIPRAFGFLLINLMQEMTGALAEPVAEKILVRTGAALIFYPIDIDTTSHFTRRWTLLGPSSICIFYWQWP